LEVETDGGAMTRDPAFGSRKARWATTVLGAVFLAEGLGKLADLTGYVAALAPFSLFDESLLGPVGVTWMVAELASGAGLLIAGLGTNPPRGVIRFAAGLGLIVTLSYMVMTGQAYLRGLEIANCTCFGVYLPQRLSLFVLFQDAYMIGYAVWQFRRVRTW
jgi:hypothetical protein